MGLSLTLLLHKELEAHAELPLPRAKGIHWPVCSMSIPERIASSRHGGQEFINLATQVCDFVSANQRPSNGGRWALSARSFMEISHVGVHAVGENHRCTGRQDHANLDSHYCAFGIATHLAIVGRGESSVPSVVHMHNHAFKQTAHRRGCLTPR